MWFDLAPRDLDFTRTSPYRLENEAVIPAPPERVFELLASGEGQEAWFKDFVACRWHGAPPRGVGSTREIELRIVSVVERILAWEPGKRFAFAIDRITLPFVKAMLEDMQLEPAGDGSTRLRWTVHYVPSLPMRLVHPIGRVVFGKMFRDSIQGLVRYAAEAPAGASAG